MGRKAQISIVAVVFTAIVAALLVYWWDSTHKDTISEGVTIGGVDVGGLEADAARSQVRTNLIAPLEKTVTVKYGGEDYTLTPRELDVHADVDGMVDRALAASQEGGLPGRTWRGLTGEEVDEAIKPQISYSHEAVDHFIEHVGSRIGTDPVDASVEPSVGSLQPVASKAGLKVDESSLRKEVESALQDPANRTIKPKPRRSSQTSRRTDLADKYPTYIVVDRANFTVTLYKNLEVEKTYTVAIGAEGFDTPTGLYTHPGQAGRSGLERARLRLGREPRRPDDPARPRKPAQGTLDGDLRRCRHPRHLRHGLARQRGLTRLRAHVRRRRDRPLRPRRRRNPRLHLLAGREAAAQRHRGPHGPLAASAHSSLISDLPTSLGT